MTISLYSASQKDGQRQYDFIKDIQLEFLPNVGFIYFDKNNQIVYSIVIVCFTEEKLSAVVSKLDDSRIEPISMLFLS